MKIYECMSDIGSVLVGNKDFGVALPNIGGDGTTLCTIYENVSEFLTDTAQRGISPLFVTSIEGEFNIYSYDCSRRGEAADVLDTIRGRYGFYQANMEVILVFWD